MSPDPKVGKAKKLALEYLRFPKWEWAPDALYAGSLVRDLVIGHNLEQLTVWRALAELVDEKRVVWKREDYVRLPEPKQEGDLDANANMDTADTEREILERLREGRRVNFQSLIMERPPAARWAAALVVASLLDSGRALHENGVLKAAPQPLHELLEEALLSAAKRRSGVSGVPGRLRIDASTKGLLEAVRNWVLGDPAEAVSGRLASLSEALDSAAKNWRGEP